MSSYQPFSATHGPGGGFDTGKLGFLTDHQLGKKFLFKFKFTFLHRHFHYFLLWQKINCWKNKTKKLSMCTVHCTLYTVHCTQCTVHCTLYTVYCTQYTVLCTLYTLHCIVHCTPYTPHFKLVFRSLKKK